MTRQLILLLALSFLSSAQVSAQDEATQAYRKARAEVRATESYEEAVRILRAFVLDYPNHRGAVSWALPTATFYLTYELDDPAGAIELAEAVEQKTTGEVERRYVLNTLIRLYGDHGKVDELNRLIEKLCETGSMKFPINNFVVGAAVKLELWETAARHADAVLSALTPDLLVEQSLEEGRETDRAAAESLCNYFRGETRTIRGYACANLGRFDEAFADFAAARPLNNFTYVGSSANPFHNFNSYLARSLLLAGRAAEAIDTVAPDAIIRVGDSEAGLVLRSAYIALNGSDEGLGSFIEEKRMQVAITAEDFTLPDYSGAAHRFIELRGRVTILTFWNPDCVPCLRELPILEQLWLAHRDAGLSIVALESSGQTERARAFIDEKNLTFHMLENGEGESEVVQNIFKVVGFPSTFVIDGDGKVLYFYYGRLTDETEAQLRRLIPELLEDRPESAQAGA